MDITKFIVTQRENALLVGDYSTYWSQTSRRVHALRKRLGQTTPRGRKHTPKAAITAEDIAKNHDYIYLLLTSAERAWAQAMSMKSAQSTATTHKTMPGSTKRQISSRLKRAISYAENLVHVLKDRTTSHSTIIDLMEAQAYWSSLKGALHFERSRWQACLSAFSLARLIYATLGSSTRADLFKELLSGTVDPSIRYAAYQMKVPRTKPVPEIVIEHFPDSEIELREEIEKLDNNAFTIDGGTESIARQGLEDLPSTVSWRSRTVKIEDAAISQALGTAVAKENELLAVIRQFNEGKVGMKELTVSYDDVINARQEAVDATKTAIDELTAEGVDPSDNRMQSLQVTRTAVNYAVIEWRVGRNRVLCGSQDGMVFERVQPNVSQKPRKDGRQRIVKEENTGRKLARLRECVALYDAILQSLDAVMELPGVTGDSAFVEEVVAKRHYFRALKCLTIGRSHAATGHFTNALALYARALNLSQRARRPKGTASKYRLDAPPKLDLSQDQIEHLENYIQGMVWQHRGLVELQNLSNPKPAAAAAGSKSATAAAGYNPPLIENLNRFPASGEVDLTNLVTYPPRIVPIPVKPLFFDLAWNYIDYPGRVSVADAVNGGASDDAIDIPGNFPGALAPTPVLASEEENKKKENRSRGWFGFGR